MQSKIDSIVNKLRATDNKKLNIVVSSSKQKYINLLSETGHNFYTLNIKWDFLISPEPKNVCPFFGNIPIKLDCMIDTENNLEANILSQNFNIPIVRASFDFAPMLKSNFYVFNDACQIANNYKSNQCEIIPVSSVKYSLTKNNKKVSKIFTCITDWQKKNKSANFLEIVKLLKNNKLNNYEIYGNNKGLSKPLSFDSLENLYSSYIYFNPISIGTTPIAVMEAIHHKAFIITMRYPGVENVLNQKKYRNYLIVEQIEDLSKIFENPENLIVKNDDSNYSYNISDFVNKWNNVLHNLI